MFGHLYFSVILPSNLQLPHAFKLNAKSCTKSEPLTLDVGAQAFESLLLTAPYLVPQFTHSYKPLYDLSPGFDVPSRCLQPSHPFVGLGHSPLGPKSPLYLQPPHALISFPIESILFELPEISVHVILSGLLTLFVKISEHFLHIYFPSVDLSPGFAGGLFEILQPSHPIALLHLHCGQS